MKKKPKPLVILHHYGLGDAIVCSGFVNHFAEKRKVYVLCYEHYAESVRCLYSHNKVRVLPMTAKMFYPNHHLPHPDLIAKVLDEKFDFLQVGFNLDGYQHNRYDYFFYEQVQLPFEYRYSKFVPPAIEQRQEDFYQMYKPKGKYVLIHNLSSQGHHPHMKVETEYEKLYVSPSMTDNIFDWVKLAKEAEEVHCTPSSFYCLLDSYNTTNRLFFHYCKTGVDLQPNNEFNKYKWLLALYPNSKRN